MDPERLWRFLLVGYLLTVMIETPILLLGLSPRHSWKAKLSAGWWLTLCTYPIVVLVLPILLDAERHRSLYLVVAETFAPLAEAALFYLAYIAPLPQPMRGRRLALARDVGTVVAANLVSFLLGGWLVEQLGL